MTKNNDSAATIAFESELWQAADALRSNMDAAEYKHVVLGLIFLKYISDAFEEYRAQLVAEVAKGADPEDPDEYRALNIFWVPQEARWSHLLANARQPTIGKFVDEAMLAIERDNPSLKGVLPKDYAHPRLDKQRLGQLIDLVGNIGLGDEASRSRDVLGRVYEYFLSRFASAEGKRGGQFYTPRCVVQVLVEMLAPYTGRVYDPCCGSGGMFVQSVEFVQAHATGNNNGGKFKAGVSIFGQESNHTTWRLAKMNLAIRGIEGNLGKEHADSFHRDLHPDLKADYVLANPPFNDSDWRGEMLKDDRRRRPTPTLPGCSTLSTTWPPPAWPVSCLPTAPCRLANPARARSARPSSRPTWWIVWSPCPASFSIRRRSRSACGSSPATNATVVLAIAAAIPYSSTLARWGPWLTAPTAS